MKIYRFKKDKIIGPVNDLEAYQMYPKYRWVYNRLELSQFQQIPCAPVPIKPTQFPVIVKPIINLYGMAWDCYLIKDESDWQKIVEKLHTGFWMPLLQGDHLSYDCIVVKGQLIWWTVFQGYTTETIGVFDYWTNLETEKVPEVIRQLIQQLDGFTGILNVEVIGSTAIEAHLRMGDLDHLPCDWILPQVNRLYSEGHFEVMSREPISQIYLIPIFVKEESQDVEIEIEDSPKIISYRIESSDTCLGHPPKYRRVGLICCTDLSVNWKVVLKE